MTWDNDDFLKGEIPSANALCSARGLAKVGAVMANGGKLGNFQIMKEATWEKMHGGKTMQVDFSSPFAGFSPVEFSRGGLAHFLSLIHI